MEHDVVNGFKATLKELLTDNGFNVSSLGREIDVNMFVVRKWLTEVKDVKLKSLIKIADYFDCSLEYLCGKTDVVLSYSPQPLPPFGEWIKTVLQSCGKTSYTYSEINYNKFTGNHVMVASFSK